MTLLFLTHLLQYNNLMYLYDRSTARDCAKFRQLKNQPMEEQHLRNVRSVAFALSYACNMYEGKMVKPKNTPNDNSTINGRRRPKLIRHRSLIEPSTGVKKNPISGDSAQTSVIF